MLKQPTDLREQNRAAILRLIAQRRPISRTDIAAALGLSSATVTAITRELVDQGLIEIVEQAPSRGGRPALRLGIVAGAATALGAKVAPDHVVAVRVDLTGGILDTASMPFSPGGADGVDAELVEFLAAFAAATPAQGIALGAGIGLPGIVRGRVVTSPMLGWHDVPVAETLEQRLAMPVLVDNDVNTLAVAEHLYGRGRDVNSFATVTLGRGVGLGLVLDGRLYRGRGGAGEFGHVVVEPGGPLCECGNRGCLEALVADPALVREAVAAGVVASADGIEALRSAADGGDTRAAAIFAAAGVRLGRAVGGAVNLLDPELVVVSGEGSAAWPHLAAGFREGFDGAAFGPLADVPVEVDPWDDAKWALGAAALVLQAPFTVGTDVAVVDVRERLHGPRRADAEAAA